MSVIELLFPPSSVSAKGHHAALRGFGFARCYWKSFHFSISFSYKTTITVLLGEPSPDLFTAITRYSSSMPLGWSTDAVIRACFFVNIGIYFFPF